MVETWAWLAGLGWGYGVMALMFAGCITWLIKMPVSLRGVKLMGVAIVGCGIFFQLMDGKSEDLKSSAKETFVQKALAAPDGPERSYVLAQLALIQHGKDGQGLSAADRVELGRQVDAVVADFARRPEVYSATVVGALERKVYGRESPQVQAYKSVGELMHGPLRTAGTVGGALVAVLLIFAAGHLGFGYWLRARYERLRSMVEPLPSEWADGSVAAMDSPQGALQEWLQRNW